MNHHRVLVGAAVAVAAAVAAPASPLAAPAASDPLGCGVEVYDPDGVLDDAEISQAVSRTADALDADVRVRAERGVDGGLEARVDQLVAECDGWAAADGELADDMVVVLFSAVEREASVYYGADLGPRLEPRWSDAVDDMIAEFPDDYTDGVVAGLRTLRTRSTTSATSSSSGSGALVGLAVIGALVVVGLVAYRKRNADGGGSWTDEPSGFMDGGSSWRSRRRRRSSFGGFSSSRSRSRSRSSSRSRSRGSRRAGGGTKRW